MIGGGLGRRRLKGLGGPWIGLEGREMVEKALLVVAAKEKRREGKGREEGVGVMITMMSCGAELIYE